MGSLPHKTPVKLTSANAGSKISRVFESAVLKQGPVPSGSSVVHVSVIGEGVPLPGVKNVLGLFALSKLPVPLVTDHNPVPELVAEISTGSLPQVTKGPFTMASAAGLNVRVD